MKTEQLWAEKQSAEKIEQAAAAQHEAAEAALELDIGNPASRLAYDAAFDAMAQARINLQACEKAYDAAVDSDSE